jgi:EAL domain-containing protein (putative c-di-GMP-specific phosphodiesterase class I)
MHDVIMPALIWYSLVILVSLWGWQLYKDFKLEKMGIDELKSWYQKLTLFFYIIFGLWTLIFLLYADEVENKLHYIAIFTQIGASVVASTLLFSDRKLFLPVLSILILPLTMYFLLIGEFYGDVLSVFSLIFFGVLIYASDNSYNLLQKNYYQAQHDALTGLYNRRYFVNYMDHVIKRVQFSKFAKELLQIMKEPYVIDRHHLYISASIGVNSIGHVSKEARQFIQEADIAMYQAKAQGRDGIILFDDELAKRVEYLLKIERRLYFALEHNEIEFCYQPQLDREQKIIGCEVLVRWNSPEFGFVSPGEFIAIAEKTGLIVELGNHIIAEAFKTLQSWDKNGLELKQFSINISVRQFLHSTFLNEVKQLSEKYLNEDTRKKIIFEVTETILIEDVSRVISIINKLKHLDFSFSMDDFGTGYSSLSSLREMPIDELKIDRSFVSHLGERESDELMITTILSMAKIFNLKTVAEGIETEEQFNFLLENGCDIFQGYYFSKPLSKDDFELFYKKSFSEVLLPH